MVRTFLLTVRAWGCPSGSRSISHLKQQQLLLSLRIPAANPTTALIKAKATVSHMSRCPHKNWIYDPKTSTEVCTDCGDVRSYEAETVRDWFKYQDSTYRKPAPYKYSRTTHFRNTLERIQGLSKVSPDLVERARKVVAGYPDDYKCMYHLFKAARLPYQQTNTLRRQLGYDVPRLAPNEVYEVNQLFENFCVFYEAHKDERRKNLPSIEYLIHYFLLAVGRPDMAAFVTKRYITNEKGVEADRIITAFLDTY